MNVPSLRSLIVGAPVSAAGIYFFCCAAGSLSHQGANKPGHGERAVKPRLILTCPGLFCPGLSSSRRLVAPLQRVDDGQGTCQGLGLHEVPGSRQASRSTPLRRPSRIPCHVAGMPHPTLWEEHIPLLCSASVQDFASTVAPIPTSHLKMQLNMLRHLASGVIVSLSLYCYCYCYCNCNCNCNCNCYCYCYCYCYYYY